MTLPFELHPEIPPEGVPNKERPAWGVIEDECHQAGLPWDPPERVPNTRAVLEVAETVRRLWPGSFEALEQALFRAHFGERRFLGDPDVVDDLLAAAGVDPDDVRTVLASGEPSEWVDTSMRVASEVGVTGTPAWLLERKLLVPGVVSREFFERAVRKLSAGG